MDAIIGENRVSMEGTGLILTHSAGISFDLTLDEAVELMEFIRVYQDTAPGIERVVIDEEADVSKHQSSEQKLLE
jgi:hypothetical protein